MKNFQWYLRLLIIITICIITVTQAMYAQEINTSTDSIHRYSNTVKFNLTSRLVYSKSFLVSYERQLKKGQSIHLFGGYVVFPLDGNFSLSNKAVSANKDQSGFSIGSDYRFYLKKENRYQAPRGVYIGPYVSYYQFKGNRTLSYTDANGTQTAGLDTKVNFINFGAELGYQFVLWDRWVIDAIVVGPALTRYNFQAKIDGQIDGLDPGETAQEIIDLMREKFPLLDELTQNKEASKNGAERFWAPGFRYSISIGFRF